MWYFAGGYINHRSLYTMIIQMYLLEEKSASQLNVRLRFPQVGLHKQSYHPVYIIQNQNDSEGKLFVNVV